MSDILYTAMYHYTRDLEYSRYPLIKGLDYKLFKQQLEFFSKNFNVVTMEQVIEAWNSSNSQLPENALLLTFDDGYVDNYLYAMPALLEYGMQGSFFIPGRTFSENVLLDVNKIHFILAGSDPKVLLSALFTKMNYYRGREWDYPSNDELFQKYAVSNRFDTKETIFIKRILQTVLPESLRNIIATDLFAQFVGIEEDKFSRELYMNHDQIRTMKMNGMFIGLHGYDHYWLGNLEKEEMQKDINKALNVMNEFIEKDNWVLNYPYGNYNEEVLSYIESKGCRLGMTTEVRIGNRKIDGRFTLPRFDCNDFPPKSERWKINKQEIIR